MIRHIVRVLMLMEGAEERSQDAWIQFQTNMVDNIYTADMRVKDVGLCLQEICSDDKAMTRGSGQRSRFLGLLMKS